MKFFFILSFFIFQIFLNNNSYAHFMDFKKLLGPYPAKGSIEEVQDFTILLNFQHTRTEQECQLAKKEEMISLKTLYGGKNGLLSKIELYQLTPLFWIIQLKSMMYSRTAKNVFKRPRPYKTDSSLIPCVKLEKSYAYPSGHTTMVRYAARVFGALMPNRAKAFLKRSDEVAKNRVLGGVHHPSDIIAGNKLGDTLAKYSY